MDLIVYDETDAFDLEPVEADLSRYGIELEVRDPLHRQRTSNAWHDWLAWHFAWSKVRSLERPIPSSFEPQDAEQRLEREALAGKRKPPGPLYDGVRLAETYHGPLPEHERPPDRGPIVVLTDRLVGTYEGSRYHVRFLVAGHPSILSVPGFLDGPARDRSYYMAKQMLGGGLDADVVSDDDRVTRKDPRLATCVASGMLQAIAYHRTGEPFCQDEACRLYNPHWQRELIESMARGELCGGHTWIQPTVP